MHILLLLVLLHTRGHHYGWTQPGNPHATVVRQVSVDPPPTQISWQDRRPVFPG